MWKPISRTSGHVLTTNIMKNTERTVVSTRTLQVKLEREKLWGFRVRKVSFWCYLVLRNGMRIPAAVAVSKSTTWSIVKTTLINFTTKARAFELSIPSTVNCCWDKCSIFWICERGRAFSTCRQCDHQLFNSLLFGNFQEPHGRRVIFRRSDIVLSPPCRPLLAWGFLSRSTIKIIT